MSLNKKYAAENLKVTRTLDCKGVSMKLRNNKVRPMNFLTVVKVFKF